MPSQITSLIYILVTVVIFDMVVNWCCGNGMDVRMLGFSASLLLSIRIRAVEKSGLEH